VPAQTRRPKTSARNFISGLIRTDSTTDIHLVLVRREGGKTNMAAKKKAAKKPAAKKKAAKKK
jgi:hypothetical protein